jgi:drug/metabolite transporter (DMT)-like permease
LVSPSARGVLLALACGFAGIALVAQPSFSSAGGVGGIGAATSLVAALAFLWLRRIGPRESSEAIVFHFACVGSLVMLLASVPVWTPPAGGDAWALATTGLCGGLGQIAMTRAYALDKAARVSALGYSGVVFARLLAAASFHEVPSATQGLGSLLVIGSGIVLAFGRSRLVPIRGDRATRAEPGSFTRDRGNPR